MLPAARSTHGGRSRRGFDKAALVLPLAYARNGLAMIASALLPAGSRILLPAYHCPALVEPFIWAGCEVDFYPMTRDLSPCQDYLAARIADCSAIVLVPFFGLKGSTPGDAGNARQQGCLVIEDLAHAALARQLDGDYGVTSLQKFYPVTTGAELLVADSVTDTRVATLWRNSVLSDNRWRWRGLHRRIARRITGNNAAETSEYRYLNPADLGEPMLANDQRLTARSNHAQIRDNRRRHYQLLARALADSHLGQPLFPALAADDVPYVFPFLLHNARHFDSIRQLALPLYRWEEIAPSGCDVSEDYKTRLVQLPCHQDLTDDDLDQLIDKLEKIRD